MNTACQSITPEGICITANGDKITTFKWFESLFGNLAGSLLALAGIVLFIFIVMGGIKYITSGGDPKAVDGAKKTISYAIGGVALIAISYLILVLLETITGVDLSKFNIQIKP